MRYQSTDDVIRHYQQHPEDREPRPQPLTTGQHVLHLLLTVFTGGLWAPVWIVRAVRGNRPRA